MSVKPVSFEIILIVDQVIDYIVDLSFKNAAILPAPGHGYADAGDKTHLIPQLLGNAVIQGQYHTAADQPGSQCLGQGTGDVRQSSGGGKGQRFACTE